MSKWDDMDMTGWVSGLTAIDEDTYRKKVVDEEAAAQGDKPALAAKEDLGLLERRLETKLDSIKNVESKIDKLLGLIYDNEEIVEERKQLADSEANKRVNEMAKIVMPLLGSLYRTQNQDYIHWPGRGPIIQKQMEKVEAILDGTYFNAAS